ncbi:hypothetical protein R1flu_026759 [Riccia fluitans]|uniref:Uncharacterized protein n=1 Tax=Riccia fluitans TaxID=41844 RepID=A0ABD1XJV5_9MARC
MRCVAARVCPPFDDFGETLPTRVNSGALELVRSSIGSLPQSVRTPLTVRPGIDPLPGGSRWTAMCDARRGVSLEVGVAKMPRVFLQPIVEHMCALRTEYKGVGAVYSGSSFALIPSVFATPR